VSNATEQIMGQIQAALVSGMPEALQPLQEAIQARVSVPVERDGGRTIRSKRGEPPRKDKGNLYANVEVSVLEGADTVRGSVSVNVPYAKTLNDDLDRPIAGDEPERHLDGIATALADRITASNT
jgi:hypothetical protein